MPKRLLDDSMLSSPSVAQLSPRAQDAFPRFILLADDFGCFDANARVLLGRGWPLRQDVSEADVAGWLAELEAAGMLERWTDGGRAFGFLTGWTGPHGQRARDEYDPETNRKGSKRRTPAPPSISRGGSAAGNPVSRSVPAPAVAVPVAEKNPPNPPPADAGRGESEPPRLRPRLQRKLEAHALRVARGQHEERKRRTAEGRRLEFLDAVAGVLFAEPGLDRAAAEARVLDAWEATGPPLLVAERVLGGEQRREATG